MGDSAEFPGVSLHDVITILMACPSELVMAQFALDQQRLAEAREQLAAGSNTKKAMVFVSCCSMSVTCRELAELLQAQFVVTSTRRRRDDLDETILRDERLSGTERE